MTTFSWNKQRKWASFAIIWFSDWLFDFYIIVNQNFKYQKVHKGPSYNVSLHKLQSLPAASSIMSTSEVIKEPHEASVGPEEFISSPMEGQHLKQMFTIMKKTKRQNTKATISN